MASETAKTLQCCHNGNWNYCCDLAHHQVIIHNPHLIVQQKSTSPSFQSSISYSKSHTPFRYDQVARILKFSLIIEVTTSTTTSSLHQPSKMRTAVIGGSWMKGKRRDARKKWPKMHTTHVSRRLRVNALDCDLWQASIFQQLCASLGACEASKNSLSFV